MQRLDAPLPQALGDDEGQLQGLGCVEPGVAVGVVPRAEVVEGDGARPADALRHVLPRHLQMHAARVAPLLLVHVEECSQLRLATQKEGS